MTGLSSAIDGYFCTNPQLRNNRKGEQAGVSDLDFAGVQHIAHGHNNVWHENGDTKGRGGMLENGRETQTTGVRTSIFESCSLSPSGGNLKQSSMEKKDRRMATYESEY